MNSLLFLLLAAATLAKLTLRVNKQMQLVELLAEETYSISATNNLDYNVKRIVFSFQEPVFQSLKIVKFYEGTTLLATESHITENRFQLNFTNPKRSGETFGFKIIAYYFQPFNFVPYKLKISEDQKIEFRDKVLNLIFDSDIVIEKLYGKYVVPNQLHSYSKELIYAETKNSYGNKELVMHDLYPPFNNKEFRSHFTYERPFELLTSASKQVDISMWGNLKFEYDFRILNAAAELDGELSNIDFQAHIMSNGRNALRQTRLQLPRDIWRLSLTDEVGNLTRPVAKYLNEDEIDLVIFPRFSLFGGWKSTYWISYNQWSNKYLFRSEEQPNLFRLDMSFTHILAPILTYDYKLSFCLPEFATFRGFESPFTAVNSYTERSHGLFEFFGKKCYTHHYTNIIDKAHNKQISVYFEFDVLMIYYKLMYVILTISMLFAVAFFISRVDLDFTSGKEKVKAE